MNKCVILEETNLNSIQKEINTFMSRGWGLNSFNPIHKIKSNYGYGRITINTSIYYVAVMVK